MLAYFLAIAVVFVSITLYLTAFFRPKIHRQDDFLWSSLGLFYALTLWICAERISGAVLLGQLAIVTLAIAFIWENRQLRQVVTTASESNQALEGFSILSLIASLLGKLPQLGQKRTIKPKKVSTVVDSPAKTIINTEETNTPIDSQIKAENQIKSPKPEDNQTDLKISAIESQKQQAIAEVSAVIDKAEAEVIDALEEIEEIVTEKIESQSEFIQEKITLETKTNEQKNNVDLSAELFPETTSEIEIKDLNNEPEYNQELAQKQESLNEESAIVNDSVKKGFFGTIINTLTKPFKGKSNPQQNQEKSPEETVTQIVENIENIEKEDEIIDNFVDEKTTASEVEKAIADFELDDSSQNDTENEANCNKVIDTEEYTAINNDGEIIEEEINPQISLTDNQKYQIESSLKDDDDLVINIHELNLDKNTDSEGESSDFKTEELSDNITQIKEIKEEDNELNLDLGDIDFDSEDIPEEDTIDSLTDLTGIEIDDNLTGELDDLLAESQEDLGKTEQFFPTEKDADQKKDNH